MDEKARAWIIHYPEDSYYGKAPDELRMYPLTPEEIKDGLEQTPLYALSPGSTGETEGWRDIESAPKDWTDMLLHDPEYDNDHRKVFEGYYDTEAGRWRDAQNAPVNPTHWRPLPAPPSAMLSAAGER